MMFNSRISTTIKAVLSKHPLPHQTNSSLLSSIEENHPLLTDKIVRFISEKKVKNNKIEISILLEKYNEFLEFISSFMSDEPQPKATTKIEASAHSDTHKTKSSTTHCVLYTASDNFAHLYTVVISEKMALLFPTIGLNNKCVLVENLEVFHLFKTIPYYTKLFQNCDVIYGAGNDVLNSYKLSFFGSYSEVICFFDFDSAGIKNFFLICDALKQSKVSFYIPQNIETLFQLAKPDFPHNLTDSDHKLMLEHKCSTPQLKILLQLMAKFRRGVEQEFCLLHP